MRIAFKKGLCLLLALLLILCSAGCKKDEQGEAASADSSVSSDISSNTEENSAPAPSDAESESVAENSTEAQGASAAGKGKAAGSNSSSSGSNANSGGKSAVAAGTGAYSSHGRLSVSGTNLVDKNNKPIQLRGVSIFFLQYANIDSFRTMRDDWGINMVRIPMYTAGYNGYCTGDANNRAKLKEQVYKGIDAATKLGLYVIVDWHVLHEGDPNVYVKESVAFFKELTAKYGGYDNVLYEICNEPNSGASWKSIKSYASQVLPAIREKAKNSVIIVGTPTWSQDVDLAAADPITGYGNLMYALHFYAETHRETLRNKMVGAIKKGLPVFVSEFGISDASGNGKINKAEGDRWMQVINQYNLSFSIWSLCNKDESSALLKPNVTKLSGWSYDDLTESGKWFVNMMGAKSEGLGKGEVKAEATAKKAEAAPTSAAAPSAQKGGLKAEAKITNSWESNGKSFYQYSLTIKNTGSAAVNGWTCKVSFDNNIALSQGWCGKYSVSGKALTVTPEDYNSEIAPNSSVDNIGFIIEADGSSAVTSVSIS